MHHSRLVGGLISLVVLLTLLLAPGAIPAEPSAVTAPASSATATPSPSATPASAPAVKRPHLTRAQRRERRLRRKRERVIRVARKQLGVPYVYGGASHGGFDCSGLTMYVYRRLGLDLSHGATDQARRGRRVSLRRLELGDLVFFGGSGYYHHVAIYAGHGRMIHAPRSGAVVSYAKLRGAVTARRLIGS